MALSSEQIKAQSYSALKQWEKQWREHAAESAKHPMKSFDVFEGSGAGRACLLIANGASFEDELETIKKYQGQVDIFVCDKALGACLDNGITPDFVIVCDANVSYEKYMEKWKDKLQDTILFQSVCANPKWINGNWKDKYFFCVKDAIESETIFQTISGCPNIIAAGTNVSNMMVIFMTQCDNEKRHNFFGYDKYLLIGFDYCWLPNKPYYAFDFEGKGKRYYMRHQYGRTLGGDYCFTSNNLAFSLEWLKKYIEVFKLPIVQCSKDTIFATAAVHGGYGDLAKHMQYKGSITEDLQALMKKNRELLELKRKIVDDITRIKKTQYYDFVASA